MNNLPTIHNLVVELFSSQDGPVTVVADTDNHRLAMWRLRDVTVWKHLGSRGTLPGQFYYPQALVVTGSEALVVTDWQRVQVLTVDGDVLCILDPSVVAGVGPLGSSLWGVVVIPGTNEILVTDTKNHRVVALTCTSDWSALVDAHAWGSQGNQLGQFNIPYGIVVTAEGGVWVTEYYNHRLSLMN
jgi:DNA-binding beta-propeller fold protein YncE